MKSTSLKFEQQGSAPDINQDHILEMTHIKNTLQKLDFRMILGFSRIRRNSVSFDIYWVHLNFKHASDEIFSVPNADLSTILKSFTAKNL